MEDKELVKMFYPTLKMTKTLLFLLIMVINGLICIDSETILKFSVSPYLHWICIVCFDLRQCKLIDGILKKIKFQHDHIWLISRLDKLSYPLIYVNGFSYKLIRCLFPRETQFQIMYFLSQ